MSSDAFLWEGAQCSKNGEHKEPYHYCMRCDEMLCDNCWFKRKKHVKSEPGHEKTIPNDAIIVYSTLKVNLDEWPLLEDAINRYRARRSSQIGDSSEWFGVRSKSKAGDYLLVEGRTYDLMMGSSRTLISDIYPGLVSFVGETGACCMLLDS